MYGPAQLFLKLYWLKDSLWMVGIMGLEDSHTLPTSSCITSPECLLLVSYHLVNSANTTVNRMVRWHKHSKQGTLETVVPRTFFLWPQWSQETPYYKCKLNIQYLVDKSPKLDLILSQLNPVHTITYCFCKVKLTTTLPSMLTSQTVSPSQFLLKVCMHFLLPPVYHTHATSVIWLFWYLVKSLIKL